MNPLLPRVLSRLTAIRNQPPGGDDDFVVIAVGAHYVQLGRSGAEALVEAVSEVYLAGETLPDGAAAHLDALGFVAMPGENYRTVVPFDTEDDLGAAAELLVAALAAYRVDPAAAELSP